MKQTFADIVAHAAGAEEPSLTDPDGMPSLGGVDPLGLRQLNFDLMDAVLPGLNNVGRRIRPFVVVAWAARRAGRLAEQSGTGVVQDGVLRAFLDRIEVVYAWSHFLVRSDVQLPGRLVLAPFVSSERYEFAGPEWEAFRKSRQASTAFTAAITYGPAIKALGWAGPVAASRKAWSSSGLFDDALDAFEATFASELEHPVFSDLETAEVTRQDLLRWAELWDMDEITEKEEEAFSSALAGPRAHARRRDTLALLREVLEDESDIELDELRAAMSTLDPSTPTRVAWRRLQVRQAFRYALESWFHWCLARLDPEPKSTSELVEAFVSSAAGSWAAEAEPGSWLNPPSERCPVAFLSRIRTALEEDPRQLPAAISEALAFCLTEPDEGGREGRADRLPLWRARSEAKAWAERSPKEFVAHTMETWLFAQHAYWSSSRGLGDARAGGKIIFRLRVVLDEGGWRLTRLGSIGSQPYPTPDRLETAWRLAEECGYV